MPEQHCQGREKLSIAAVTFPPLLSYQDSKGFINQEESLLPNSSGC